MEMLTEITFTSSKDVHTLLQREVLPRPNPAGGAVHVILRC